MGTAWQSFEDLNKFLTDQGGRRTVGETPSRALDNRDSPIGGCGASLGMVGEQCDR